MTVVLSKNLVLTTQDDPRGPASPNAPLIAWESFLTFETVTSDYEDESYPVTNLGNESTALEWRSSETGDQYIYVETPGDRETDYVAFATHNLSSAGTEISVEVLTDEATWEEVVSGFVLPNDGPAIVRFVPTTTTGVRIRLQNSSLPPAISVVYVGPLLLLPRNIYVGHTPINYARHTEVTSGKNEAGDFLGRIVTRRSKSSDLRMGNIPPDWFRTYFEPFMEHAVEFPFFFAWRPRDYPFEVGYIWTTDDITSSNQLANGFMEFGMSFAGIAGRAGVPMLGRGPRWTKTPEGWVRNY